jgi:hypothetical protein
VLKPVAVRADPFKEASLDEIVEIGLHPRLRPRGLRGEIREGLALGDALVVGQVSEQKKGLKESSTVLLGKAAQPVEEVAGEEGVGAAGEGERQGREGPGTGKLVEHENRAPRHSLSSRGEPGRHLYGSPGPFSFKRSACCRRRAISGAEGTGVRKVSYTCISARY